MVMNTKVEINQAFSDYQNPNLVIGHGKVSLGFTLEKKDVLQFMLMALKRSKVKSILSIRIF
jgi:hypothetical protein